MKIFRPSVESLQKNLSWLAVRMIRCCDTEEEIQVACKVLENYLKSNKLPKSHMPDFLCKREKHDWTWCCFFLPTEYSICKICGKEAGRLIPYLEKYRYEKTFS